MTRLFDIAAFWPEKNIEIMGSKQTQKLLSSILDARRMLRRSTVLDATSIGQAYREWMAREPHTDDLKKALLNCLPPWRNTFVVVDGFLAGGIGTIGIQCGQIFPGDLTALGLGEFEQGSTHQLLVHTWLGKPGSLKALYRAPMCAVLLDENGAFMRHGSFSVLDDGREIEDQVIFEDECSDKFSWMIVTLPLFAFQLMHCRNIKRIESSHRPCMPKGKKGKIPKISFHSLRISDALVVGGSNQMGGGGGETAKHICRGNFAHYTEENKLFGKYVGMFWRPMHIRGNAKHGIVGKEYSIDGDRKDV